MVFNSLNSKKSWIFSLIFLGIIFFSNSSAYAQKTLISNKRVMPISIDGKGNESVWKKAQHIDSYDKIAGITITIQSLYDDSRIYFLVSFRDPDESRKHRYWHWNQDNQMYIEGPEREDVFVFKWALEPQYTDISLKSDSAYSADIWYWKASRTDPEGVADDKVQHYSKVKTKNTQKIVLESGNLMFLKRSGDSGKSSYKTQIYADKINDTMERYQTRPPQGSRSDISAKGHWKDGVWTLEFSRQLITGNSDDINFSPLDVPYTFGISRYEIAGNLPNLNIEQPLYGSGDIAEHLILTFKK